MENLLIIVWVGFFWFVVIPWLWRRGVRPTIWILLSTAGRRLQFYFSWLSFTRRRRRTERFLALADRFRRNNVRKPVDRNLISGS
jgi:hypothetical protein